MKIVDVKCAVIGRSPVVRIVSDEGISGYGQVETWKPYLKPHVLALREALIGEDPRLVERVMRRIRQRGGFKPWGAAVSVIEMALWDLAGKAAGVPVHRLLGGKVRDRVRVYNGAMRFPRTGSRPEDYADDLRRMMALPEGFGIIKQGVAFHSPMKREVEGFYYGEPGPALFHGALDRGPVTEKGLRHVVDCVAAMQDVAGERVGLALDCGPGWILADAIRLARRLEPYGLLWIEDLLSGDYTPWVDAGSYRELTRVSPTPIHTGEQIYLRQNFKELIESQAVNVIGPDPGRCRRDRRAEMDRGAGRPPRHIDGAARHRGRAPGAGGAGSGLRDAAGQFHRLRVSDRRSGVVERDRRGSAGPDRAGRHDRGRRPPGHGG